MKAAMGPLKGILPTDFPVAGRALAAGSRHRAVRSARVADRIPGGQRRHLQRSRSAGAAVHGRRAHATNYPTSIIVHGIGLNITVQSYDQNLDFLADGDAAAMPDVKSWPRPSASPTTTWWPCRNQVTRPRGHATGAVAGRRARGDRRRLRRGED